MKIAIKPRTISLILIFFVAFATGYAQSAHAGGTHLKVAKTYGVESFGQVEQIRYTFNVQIGEKNIARSWAWEPKTSRVTFVERDKKTEPFVYYRNAMGENPPEKIKKIDQRFINDQYWLLFPLHLKWDDKAKIEDTGTHKLPMGKGSGTRLVVTYPPTGGYTPGDVYELFIDADSRITEWIFRRGGTLKNPRIVSWEDHKRLGPLLISFNHKGSDGKFRLWFTDVAVQLEGSPQWIEAK